MMLSQKLCYKFSFGNFVKSQVRSLHTSALNEVFSSFSAVTWARKRKRPYGDLYKMTLLDEFSNAL